MNLQSELNRIKFLQGPLKRWHKIVIALSILVVFSTVYVLIKPAMALSPEMAKVQKEIGEYSEINFDKDSRIIASGSWGGTGVKWHCLQENEGVTLVLNGKGSLTDSKSLRWRQDYGDIIKKIVICDGVNNARYVPDLFSKLSNLESVCLPEGFKYLGERGFAETNLKEICIPNGIYEIEKETFDKCENLEKIVFKDNENISRIALCAFTDCKKLKTVEFPNTDFYFNVEDSFRKYAGRYYFEEMEFPANNYIFKDKYLIGSNGDLVYYSGGYEEDVLVMPEEVKELIPYNSLSIPNERKFAITVEAPGINARYIREGALFGVAGLKIENCTKFVQINEDRLQYLEVGNVTEMPRVGQPHQYENANYMNSLKTIKTGDTLLVDTIPKQCFFKATSFNFDMSLYKNLTTIGEKAFYNNFALEDVYLGTKVKSIGSEAFNGCNNVKTLTYDIHDMPETGNNVFKAASFEKLVIGKNVATVSEEVLDDMMSKSKEVVFEGENYFQVDGTIKGSTDTILHAGKYYVNENGVVFKLSDDMSSASVAFISKQEGGKVTIPKEVSTEKGKKIPVKGIEDYALFRTNHDLKEVTFEDPNRIVDVGNRAFSNMESGVKVNGKTDKDAIIASFPNAKNKVKDSIDYTPDTSGFGKEVISLEKSDCEFKLELVDEYKNKNNTYLTGQKVVLLLTHDGEKLKGPVGAKVYFQFSNRDGKVLKPQSQGGSLNYVLADGDRNNTQVLVFDKLNTGGTFGLRIPCKFNENTKGGTMKVWMETCEPTDTPTTEIDIVKIPTMPKDNYMELKWIYENVDYKVENQFIKSSTYDPFGLVGDGTSSGSCYYTNLTLKETINVENKELLKGDLGKNPVEFFDVTTDIEFGDNVEISDKVIKAFENNKIYMEGSNVKYPGEDGNLISIMRLPNKSGNIKFIKDDKGKYQLRINYILKSQNTGEYVDEIPFYEEFIKVIDPSKKVTLGDGSEATGEIKANTKVKLLTALGDNGTIKSNEAKHKIDVFPEPDLKVKKTIEYIDKNRGISADYWGEKVTYNIDVSNKGSKEDRGVEYLNDPLPKFIYLSPRDMAEILTDDTVSDVDGVVIQIFNPSICLNPKNNKVYNTKGEIKSVTAENVGVDTDYSGDCKSEGTGFLGRPRDYRIMISRSGDAITTSLFEGNDEIYGPPKFDCSACSVDDVEKKIDGFLSDLHYYGSEPGYAFFPNVDTNYAIKWDMKKEKDGKPKPVYPGEEYRISFKANICDTFYQLEKDRPRCHDQEDRSYIYNYIQYGEGYFAKNGRSTANLNTVAREYYLGKKVFHGKERIDTNGNYLIAPDGILTHDIVISHYGKGTKKILPVVERVNGNSVVVVPVDGNEHLSSHNLDRTNDGVNVSSNGKYYILDKEGEYSKVDTGGNIASSIKVEKDSDGDLSTYLKWFISDPTGTYIKDIYYETVAKDVGSKLSFVSNYTWLNDHQAHRLVHASTGTILRFDKNIVEEQGAGPDEDVLVPKRFKGVEEGCEITYRFDLRNTADWKLILDGTEFYDMLPTTYDEWEWEKGKNVSLKFSSSANDGSIKTQNLDEWRIEKDPSTNRQKIVWDGVSDKEPAKGTRITYEKAGTVYVYCTLKFPGGDTFNEFANKAGSRLFDNALYVYNMPVLVHHQVVEQGKAALQKGVDATNIKDKYENPPKNIRFLCGRDNEITFFVSLTNTGNTRLYINTIEDILPKQFIPYEVRIPTYQNSLIGREIGQYRVKTQDGYSKNLTGKVHYSCKRMSDGRSLVKFDVSGPDIPYDENMKKHYLNKNESIYFIYACKIDSQFDGVDGITNKVSMAYTDVNDKGVKVDQNIESEPRMKDELYKNALTNNGTKQRINNGQAEAMGFTTNDDVKERLYSEVTLFRDKVRPGITKKLVSIEGKDLQPGDSNIADVGDTLTWKVTLYNDSFTKITMDEIKLFDEFENPYKIKSIKGKYYYSKYERQFHNGKWRESASSIPGRFNNNIYDIKTVYSTYVAKPEIYMDRPCEVEIVMEPTSTEHDKSMHINNAKMYLKPKVPYEGDKVSRGQFIKGSKPEENHILAEDHVVVLGSHDTEAHIEVADSKKPETKNASSKNSEQNKINVANKTRDIHYDLYLSNNSTENLKDVVMIDNMAHKDDGYTAYDAYKRHSDFPIKMDAARPIKVFITKDGSTDEVPFTDYKIAFSTKGGEFTENEWNSLDAKPSTKWHDNLNSEEDKSVRLLFKSLPPKSKIRVEIPAKIGGDSDTAFGKYGWTSYSYRYNVENGARQNAGTLKVGVGYGGVPQISKKLVDTKGNPRKADRAETFKFLIYKGEMNGAIPKDDIEKAKTYLKSNDIPFEEIPIQVAEGKDGAKTLLTDKNSEDAKPVIQNWLWEDCEGQKFTVLEFPSKDSQYKTKSLGDGGKEFYTFTQNKMSFANIEAVNALKEWDLELTKVSKKDRKEVIKGAVFGLYSPDEADKKSFNGADYGLKQTQLKPEIKVDGATYYLCSIETTNREGKLLFSKLQQNSYKLVELKVDDRYVLDTDPITVDYNMQQNENKNIQIVVTNPKKIILPKTGGPGKWAIMALGLGLMGAGCVVALRKWKRL